MDRAGEEDWEHDQPVLYGIGERRSPDRDREAAGKTANFPAEALLDDAEAEAPRSGAQDDAREAPAAHAPWEAAPDDTADGEEPREAADGEPGPDAAASTSDGTPGSSPEAAPASGAGAANAGKPYRMPPMHLLNKPQGGRKGSAQDVLETARKLEATLESFGVRAKVLDVSRGPAVTRYEVQPDVGVKVSRIVSLTDDIALALAAKDIRMEAPIPGKSAIGIEVPNPEISIVTLREVLESDVFREAPGKLTIAFGRDISGQPVVGNLARMPHLLVAGATGSGKSVCINTIIMSLLYKAKPDEVKLLLIDPKMVELNVYNGIPHLLAPVVTDPRRASLALKKIVVEMEQRYEKFSATGTRNIEGYNALMTDRGQPEQVLPYIVVIVDELADLMMVAAGDVEDAITRLAQMARAAGIHLILATQRPSVDVITGVIKANIPSRIAFGVSSQVDSRTILDMAGAGETARAGGHAVPPHGRDQADPRAGRLRVGSGSGKSRPVRPRPGLRRIPRGYRAGKRGRGRTGRGRTDGRAVRPGGAHRAGGETGLRIAAPAAPAHRIHAGGPPDRRHGSEGHRRPLRGQQAPGGAHDPRTVRTGRRTPVLLRTGSGAFSHNRTFPFPY